MNAKFVVIFLMLLACASQKQVVKKDDALQLLTDLTRETNSPNFEFTNQKASEIEAKLDSLCENKIIVYPTSDIEKFSLQLEKIKQLDDILVHHAQKGEDNGFEISLREFKFRTLAKIQEQMNALFENKEIRSTAKVELDSLESDKDNDFDKGEVHGKWVFQKRVSMMLPVMQANEKMSKEKSGHLMKMFDLLDSSKDNETRWRSWVAIDRMLAEIDVQKSESGYRPFQRSAAGIYTRPGEIMEKLKALHKKENDIELQKFSKIVLKKLEKNLNAKKTGEFWQHVEFSRELQKRIESGGLDQQGAAEKEISAGKHAANEWFNKGYAASDDRLKIDYYTSAIEFDSSYVSAYNNRGNAFQALGMKDSALADFNRSIALDSVFAPAHINRGNILQEMGRHEDAIYDFSKAIELESKYTLAFCNRGKSYKDLGMYEHAIQDFNRVIQLEPNFVSAYFHRGDVHRKMGNDLDAIFDYTKAIELDPANAVAYNNRGLSNNNLKKYQQAIRDYKKAIEISPDYAAAYYNLGIVYWTLNRWKDVVNAWEKSLALNPDQSFIIEYLPTAKRQVRKMR